MNPTPKNRSHDKEKSMTHDEIYDHLAQVYLGKRKGPDPKKHRQLSSWLLVNVLITAVIFGGAFYGLTAFLTQRNSLWRKNVIFTLHDGLVRLSYSFEEEFSPVKSFVLSVPKMDTAKYQNLQFSVRAKDDGNPGIVKITLRNHRNETASYYIQGVDFHWQEFRIPLAEFKQITDWTNLRDISFVLESWNVEKKKGVILIDHICFSS